MADPSRTLRSQILSIVSLIPSGRVATYGSIAALAGVPRQARQVGYALAALGDLNDVPWHRVINSLGEISKRADAADEARQRMLLEAEGVCFDAEGRVDLSRFQWRPDRPPPSTNT
jgi:methylated-DNA-protein-cysteine methyltransferase-like protein